MPNRAAEGKSDSRAWGPGVLLRLLLLGCLGLPGCRGSSAPAPPETYPVTGTVVGEDGQPLSGGAIYFHPTGDASTEALADIQADGSFSLYTMAHGEKYPGAVAGPHEVTVIPPPSGPDDIPPATRLPETVTVEREANQLTIRVPGTANGG
jgi:hypothetical protein